MPKILVCAALLLLSVPTSYAQWEKVEVIGTDESGPTIRILRSSPHPLQFYLTPTAERDPTNSLGLGCRITTNGRKRTLQDYVVDVSQRPLGESFGKRVIQIVLSFWDRDMSAQTSQAPSPIQWKSIVVESSPEAYRESYLLINNGMFDHKQSQASLYSVEGTPILEVAAYLSEQFNGNTEFRENGYWALEADGPRLIDFSGVEKEVTKSLRRTVTAQAHAAAWT